MKVLILSSGRSGSSSLSIGLSQSINSCNLFFEPFAPYNNDSKNLSKNDLGTPTSFLKHHCFLKNSNFPLVEKHIAWDPCLWEYISFNNIFYEVEYLHKIKENIFIESCLSFYLEYSKLFDIIILLDRKNVDDLVNSWGQARFTRNFFLPYKNNPNININVGEEMEKIFLFKEILSRLSNKLNLPITYYEDLFTGKKQDTQNFLNNNNIQIDNFEILFEHLHPKNRLRQN